MKIEVVCGPCCNLLIKDLSEYADIQFNATLQYLQYELDVFCPNCNSATGIMLQIKDSRLVEYEEATQLKI